MCGGHPYVVEVGVLRGSQAKPVLLILEVQQAGKQPLRNLQVVAIETRRCLGDVAQLIGKLLLHDGAEVRLVPLHRLQLYV